MGAGRRDHNLSGEEAAEMNRTHPPRYPRRLREEDYTLVDVLAGLVTVVCMIAVTWALFALGAN